MLACIWPFPTRSVRLAATVAAAIVAASSIAVSVLAQDGGQSAPEPDTTSLVSLEFPGGSALDYVEAVRRATGVLNIMVAAEAAEVRVPPVTLRRVTRQAALDLLDGRQVRTLRHAIELAVREMPTYDVDEEPTFQIVAEVHGDQPRSAARVWTVRGLVDGGLSSEAILSAVELAMEMTGAGGGGPDVRFHQDTGLLIARGEQDHLAVIEQVVAGLSQSRQERSANEAATLRAEYDRLQARIAELGQMVQAKEAELVELRTQLQQLRNERPGNPR